MPVAPELKTLIQNNPALSFLETLKSLFGIPTESVQKLSIIEIQSVEDEHDITNKTSPNETVKKIEKRSPHFTLAGKKLQGAIAGAGLANSAKTGRNNHRLTGSSGHHSHSSYRHKRDMSNTHYTYLLHLKHFFIDLIDLKHQILTFNQQN
jgi:hypothetical protein